MIRGRAMGETPVTRPRLFPVQGIACFSDVGFAPEIVGQARPGRFTLCAALKSLQKNNRSTQTPGYLA